jgi:7-cyano-7-deazaguanine synthase
VKELVLLSGGIDSAVLLWRAREPVALFVDYGQPARAEELAASVALATARTCLLMVSTVTIDLEHMADGAGVTGPRVVGGRNLILIGLGINAAVASGCGVVWIGAQAGDSADYPDCRPLFITALDRINRTAYGVGVDAPLVMCSRASLAAEARMRVPHGLTWSCYAPSSPGVPCGACNSCKQER